MHVQLRLPIIGLSKTLFPGHYILSYKARGQFLLYFGSAHFVEIAFIAEATLTAEFIYLHAFCDFFQLIAKVDGFEIAAAKHQFIELLFVDGPHFLKPQSKMLFEHLTNVLPPNVALFLTK